MRNLVLSTESASGYTAVSDIFIDHFIPNSNGEFVKIYLYLLRLLSNKSSNLSISSLADTFNQTESDVIRALRYWDKLGLLELEYTSDNTICGITLKDLNNNSNSLASRVSDASSNGYNLSINLKNEGASKQIMPAKEKSMADFSTTNNETRNQTANELKPSMIAPTPEKMTKLNDEEEFSLLIFAIQAYLGRPLVQKETNLIVYLYDELNFSSSLIDYLFAYCIQNSHTDIRYIEATALAWHSKGITSTAEAKEEVTNHSNATISVLKAFGLKNRELGSSEKDYINRWNKEYKFSPEIIAEACDRSLIKTGQASFPYAESVLKTWYDDGVKTFEDIAKSDANFNAKKTASYSKQSSSRNNNLASKSSNKNKTNKFNNFQQREYSQEFYDSLYDNM